MRVENWGLIDYKTALEKQQQLVEEVYQDPAQELIVICHHPPVVTMGKKATADDLCGWQGDVVNVTRGGKATYHGPKQVVAYPIINIKTRSNDVYWYVRTLEDSIVRTLKKFDINSIGDPNSTGVWVDNRKIASIGIAVKRWITYHGLALNLFQDDMAFVGIKACGMNNSVMTSVSEILGQTIVLDQNAFRSNVEKLLANELLSLLTL